ERACQVAWYLKTKKPRAKLIVLDANQNVVSKTALFRKAWEAYPNLEYRASNKVTKVDPGARTVTTDLGDVVKYDVVNVIPPQRAGTIAVEADLAGADAGGGAELARLGRFDLGRCHPHLGPSERRTACRSSALRSCCSCSPRRWRQDRSTIPGIRKRSRAARATGLRATAAPARCRSWPAPTLRISRRPSRTTRRASACRRRWSRTRRWPYSSGPTTWRHISRRRRRSRRRSL